MGISRFAGSDATSGLGESSDIVLSGSAAVRSQPSLCTFDRGEAGAAWASVTQLCECSLGGGSVHSDLWTGVCCVEQERGLVGAAGGRSLDSEVPLYEVTSEVWVFSGDLSDSESLHIYNVVIYIRALAYNGIRT